MEAGERSSRAGLANRPSSPFGSSSRRYGEFFTHTIAGEPVLFFHGGWGKIDAAASAEYIIGRWRPLLLINLGTCGGIDGRMQRLERLIVNRTVVYDIHEAIGDSAEAIAAYSTDIDLDWLGDQFPLRHRRASMYSADRDLIRVRHLRPDPPVSRRRRRRLGIRVDRARGRAASDASARPARRFRSRQREARRSCRQPGALSLRAATSGTACTTTKGCGTIDGAAVVDRPALPPPPPPPMGLDGSRASASRTTRSAPAAPPTSSSACTGTARAVTGHHGQGTGSRGRRHLRRLWPACIGCPTDRLPLRALTHHTATTARRAGRTRHRHPLPPPPTLPTTVHATGGAIFHMCNGRGLRRTGQAASATNHSVGQRRQDVFVAAATTADRPTVRCSMSMPAGVAVASAVDSPDRPPALPPLTALPPPGRHGAQAPHSSRRRHRGAWPVCCSHRNGDWYRLTAICRAAGSSVPASGSLLVKDVVRLPVDHHRGRSCDGSNRGLPGRRLLLAPEATPWRMPSAAVARLEDLCTVRRR